MEVRSPPDPPVAGDALRMFTPGGGDGAHRGSEEPVDASRAAPAEKQLRPAWAGRRTSAGRLRCCWHEAARPEIRRIRGGPGRSRGQPHQAGDARADARWVTSSGAILTRRGMVDLQRLAGNAATRTLIQLAPAAGVGAVVQREAAKGADPSAPEESWDGSIKGHLGEHPATYHTLNNFSDRQLRYHLRIHNTGYALLNLETQYQYRSGKPERAWIAISAQRGDTEEVTNGLPARSSLRLRLFGERDHTRKDETYIAGTVAVRRQR